VASKDGDLLNNCNKTKAEDNFDSSDSISVITENSDTDSNNRIFQVNNLQSNNTFQDKSRSLRLKRQVKKQQL